MSEATEYTINYEKYRSLKHQMDIFTSKKRSEIMAKVKSRNTKPELEVKQFLLKHKIRPSTKKFKLPGQPDFILPKYKTVIFVHGCFWHQHNCSRGKRVPKSNIKYWKSKLEKNVIRDRKNDRELKKIGWKAVKIWECQIKDKIKLEKIIKKHFSDIK